MAQKGLGSADPSSKVILLFFSPIKFYSWKYKGILSRITDAYSKNWLLKVVLQSIFHTWGKWDTFSMCSVAPFATRRLASVDSLKRFFVLFYYFTKYCYWEYKDVLSRTLNVFSKNKFQIDLLQRYISYCGERLILRFVFLSTISFIMSSFAGFSGNVLSFKYSWE